MEPVNQPVLEPAPEPNPPQRSTALAAISWMRDLFVSVMIAAVVILFL